MIFPKALRYWGALLKTMRVQKREIILDGRDFFHFRKNGREKSAGGQKSRLPSIAQRGGGFRCQLLEQRPKVIRAIISKNVESIRKSTSLICIVPMVCLPRASCCN